ncbi:Rieske 2Fe-2S domain-containing protein [Caballeronia sp. LjRoot31]|uniref:Rieske 2Fe-2S domain-containing protein n=1 Tax=Caballeronia sp. LjRoot31 TaxID=3342324 RepID=UPI003ED0674F
MVTLIPFHIVPPMIPSQQLQHDAPDSWYAVAASDDLMPATVMPVTVHSQRIALWRSASGHASAWGDRCPHRGMRLSFGAVRGESLLCPYHGWTFGTDGQCIHMPAHPDIVPPKAACAQRYAVTESNGYVWLNLGQPAGSPPLDGPRTYPVRTLYFPVPVDAALAALISVAPHASTSSGSHAPAQIDVSDSSTPERLVFKGTDERGSFVASLDRAGGLMVESEGASGQSTFGAFVFPSDEATCGVHVVSMEPAPAERRIEINRAAVAVRNGLSNAFGDERHVWMQSAIAEWRTHRASEALARMTHNEETKCRQ